MAAYCGIAFEQLAILLEGGPASRGIGDHRVEAAGQHGVDIAAGQLARFLGQARVDVQRAAASLVLRDDHFAAVLLEHPHGGFVQSRKRHVGDASGQESDPVALGAERRKGAAHLAEEERRIGRGRKLLQISQAAQQLQETQGAHQGLHAAGLVQVEQRSGERHGGARLQHAEGQPAHLPREPAPVDLRFDLRPRILHHAAIAHARGAGRFASAAGQAQADVLHVGRRDRRAVGHLHHLVDAAARRIHLQTQLAIRRAGVEAEPAMHATVQVELARSGSDLFRCGYRVGHDSTHFPGQTAS